MTCFKKSTRVLHLLSRLFKIVYVMAFLAGLFVVGFEPILNAQPISPTYVDTDATSGSNDGTSWTDAYLHLQDALDQANDNPNTHYEIWVAEGVYYPDEETHTDPIAHVNNDPSEFFRLHSDNVKLYGGFAGGESSLDQRDRENNVTVLSGDILQDDTNTDGNFIAEDWNDIQGTNAYHVLYLNGQTGGNITDDTVIDGFVVTAGEANSGNPHNMGGGVYCDGKEGTCNPVLTNIVLSGNYAVGWGGGMISYGDQGESSPILTNVAFEGNKSDSNGGGIYNRADYDTTSPVLTNVVFKDNYAASEGGGMYNYCYYGTCSPSLTNVTFSGNHADDYGGGISNWNQDGTCSPSLVNVIMWSNTAGSDNPEIRNASSEPVISFSDIQGCGGSGPGWQDSLGTDNGNNIDADPLFTNADSGHLSLQSQSPAVNSGNSDALPSDTQDLDADGDSSEKIPYDLANNNRVDGSSVDIGAYEFQIITGAAVNLLLLNE